jgi:TRAP-type C4-dicarboxylate transport system substrate-binding protein
VVKKCLFLFLAVILAAGLVLAGCSTTTTTSTPVTSSTTSSPTTTAVQAITMRCAAEFGPTEPISMVMKELETIVPEATGGRVKFEYYPAAQLYTFADGVTAMQAGDLEMGMNGMPISFFVPEWDIICNLLFLVDDNAHLQRICDTDTYKDLVVRMEAKGIKPITRVYPMGDQPLFNNKRPIIALDDFKGLKLSVGPGPTFLEAMKLLSGSEPVNVPVPEVPSALETGMVDGSPFPWPVMSFIDFPRLMPYVTEVSFGLSFPVGLVVSAKWWDTLPADLQQTLQTTFEDAMTNYGQMVVSVNDEMRQKYTDSPNTTVTVLTDAQLAVWKDALKPLYDEVKQDPNLLAIIQAAEATRQ